MSGTIVVGVQWGDEGKGKIVDLLSEDFRHVVRSQGGNNAGHTLKVGERVVKLHLIPSGILHPEVKCYIADGVVVDLEVLEKEIEMVGAHDRLIVSPGAHVILEKHREQDAVFGKEIGTTGCGIGPCYTDKTSRIGKRVGDMEEEWLKPFVKPVAPLLHAAMQRGEAILFEGAQGTLLDLTFGTYPYVTSSHTLAAGVLAGAGVGPTAVDEVIGVFKAYTTRVGAGPFPTEANELDAKQANEIGTTTGRLRRMGWIDTPLVRYAVQLNGVSMLAMTKLDILDQWDIIKICTGYVGGEIPLNLADAQPIYEELPGWQQSTRDCRVFADLPKNAKAYIERVEELVEAPIGMISVGPERKETLYRDTE